MVVPCIASVNSNGNSRKKKKAFKPPSKTYQVHLLVLGVVQNHVFVERYGNFPVSCNHLYYYLVVMY